MKFFSLDHYPILPDSSWKADKTLEFVLDVQKGSGKRLVFEYIVKPAHNLPAPHHGKSPSLDIKIEDSTWIQIELSKNCAWHWDTERAVTMGVAVGDYVQLEYKTSTGFDLDSKGEACRIIRFGARKAVDGNLDDPYPFNMNILIECADGHILPITVDPDIRNPGRVP